MPWQICDGCLEMCEKFMTFREMCHENEKLLHSVVTRKNDQPQEEVVLEKEEDWSEEFEEATLPEEIIQEEEAQETQEHYILEMYNEEKDNVQYEEADHSEDTEEVNWSDLECFIKVTCPFCPLEANWSIGLHGHIRDHLVENDCSHNCPKCEDSYESEEDLLRHIYEHINTLFPCPRCDLCFAYPLDLIDHARSDCFKLVVLEDEEVEEDSNEITGQIPRQDKRPPTKAIQSIRRKRIKRQKVSESESVGPKACEICGKILKDHVNYERHRLRHTSALLYQCNQCEASFVFASELASHTPYHDTANHKYICNECDPPKKYFYKRSLQAHMARNHKERVRDKVCTVCDKAFFSPADLKKHELIHSEVKQFKCGDCSQRFTRADHLRTHMKTHQRRKV